MIFAIGLCLIATGWVTQKFFGSPLPGVKDDIALMAALLLLSGLGLLLLSVCILAWRYLP